MTTTTVIYHPAWVTWPDDHPAGQPGDLSWLALALALAIAGLAVAQLLIVSGLLVLPAAYTLAALAAAAGLGISLGVLRNEVDQWNEVKTFSVS